MQRENKRTFRRIPYVIMTVCLASVWSCEENKETTIYETIHDTLRIYDTTILRLIVRDTLYVASGRSPYVLFGIAYDLRGVDSSGSFDSAYVGLTCFSNPARRDLRVNVNSDSVSPEDSQRQFVLRTIAPDLYYGVPFPAVNFGALLTGTLWESFVPARKTYAFEVIVPVYPSDTALPPSFDTIRHTIAVPGPVDGVRVSGNSESYSRTYNSRLRDTCYVVPGDSVLTLTWNDSADYYVVTVYKLRYFIGYGYDLVDTPYDTIVTVPTCRLPAGELSRSSVSDGYDVAEVHFLGLNGPEPSSWDTLPSFEGRGIAVAVSYHRNNYELLVPQGSPVLAKGIAIGPFVPYGGPQEIRRALCRTLGRARRHY